MKNEPVNKQLEELLVQIHFKENSIPSVHAGLLTDESKSQILAFIASEREQAEKLAIYNFRANVLAENYCTELGTYDYDGIAEMVLKDVE